MRLAYAVALSRGSSAVRPRLRASDAMTRFALGVTPTSDSHDCRGRVQEALKDHGMSAIGPQRTSLVAPHMSAFGVERTWHVALHESAFDPADIDIFTMHVWWRTNRRFFI